MRIDLKNNKNIKQHAKYKKFQIGNEDTRYSLYVNDHTGTATNELIALNTNSLQHLTMTMIKIRSVIVLIYTIAVGGTVIALRQISMENIIKVAK